MDKVGAVLWRTSKRISSTFRAKSRQHSYPPGCETLFAIICAPFQYWMGSFGNSLIAVS
jgi:hypothetical protein